MTDKEEAIRFLEANPDVEVLEAYVVDVNAVPRGKWIPRERALDVLTDGMAIPRSVYALDVWGRDVAAAGLAKVAQQTAGEPARGARQPDRRMGQV